MLSVVEVCHGQVSRGVTARASAGLLLSYALARRLTTASRHCRFSSLRVQIIAPSDVQADVQAEDQPDDGILWMVDTLWRIEQVSGLTPRGKGSVSRTFSGAFGGSKVRTRGIHPAIVADPGSGGAGTRAIL
jgi:hypothetical protein